MDIQALEYSEDQQCFHFNTDTTKQQENTNRYVTIAKNISYEQAEAFTKSVKTDVPRTLSSIKADFITFIQKN